MTATLEGVTLAEDELADGEAYRTIESGDGIVTTTSTENGDQSYTDVTIYDQTWKDADTGAVNGVATVTISTF